MYNELAPGYDQLYEEEQNKKLNIIKENLEVKNTDKLLDVGCGSGISSQFNCDVTGIDPSEELLKIAGKKFPHMQFMMGKAETLPFNNASFDIVVSLTAVHNFDNFCKGLEEIKRVGKDKFAITVLKKCQQFEDIKKKIEELFIVKKVIEEDKDFIFII